MKVCPVVRAKFERSVNMTPAQIRSWAKNPKAKLASFESTRRRLPALARLKAKRKGWTSTDCAFAQRVVSFNARFDGMIRAHGCTPKMTIAERNWGRQPPACPLP